MRKFIFSSLFTVFLALSFSNTAFCSNASSLVSPFGNSSDALREIQEAYFRLIRIEKGDTQRELLEKSKAELKKGVNELKKVNAKDLTRKQRQCLRKMKSQMEYALFKLGFIRFHDLSNVPTKSKNLIAKFKLHRVWVKVEVMEKILLEFSKDFLNQLRILFKNTEGLKAAEASGDISDLINLLSEL